MKQSVSTLPPKGKANTLLAIPLHPIASQKDGVPRDFMMAFNRAADFLLGQTGWNVDKVLEHLEDVTCSFENKASLYPESCQTCPETELLGMPGFREFHKGGYRIVYLYNDRENKVFAMLFLHQRQSVQKELIDHCLHF